MKSGGQVDGQIVIFLSPRKLLRSQRESNLRFRGDKPPASGLRNGTAYTTYFLHSRAECPKNSVSIQCNVGTILELQINKKDNYNSH
jgi:hypothetical protein